VAAGAFARCPYEGDAEAVRFLDGATDQRELSAHGNAERLLGLN